MGIIKNWQFSNGRNPKIILFSLFLIPIFFTALSLTGCDSPASPATQPPATNQTPVATDFVVGNLNQTAGSVTAVTITPKQGKSTGAITIFYNGSTALPTNAGSYTVTFNVAAVTGWNAATGLAAGTLNISATNQTPVAEDYTISGLTQTFNGSPKVVTITPKAGKSTGTRTIYYEGTGSTIYVKTTSAPSAVGTYNVTFSVAAVAGWNTATNLTAGTLNIIAANQTPVASDYDIGNLSQFVGNVTAVTITPKVDKSTGAITILYNGSTILPTTAGIYTVTFNVAAAPGWNAASYLSAGSLTISNQTPVVTDYDINGLTQYYTGSPMAVTIIPKAGKSTGAITIYYQGSGSTIYAITTTAPYAVGTYTVTFNVATVAGWNAATGLLAGTLTISNQTPVATDYDISGLEQFYNGSSRVVTITPIAGKSTGTRTIYYQGSGSTIYAITTTAPYAVGTYTVTFNVAAVAGWNTASGLLAGTLTISNQTPVATDYTISGLIQTFNGSPKAVTITPMAGKSTGARTIYYEGTGSTTYAKTTTAPSTAGTYTVTFNVAAVIGWDAATGLIAGILNIAKSNGTAVSTPMLNTITSNSITIKAVQMPANGQTVEYSIATTDTVPADGWQDELVFTGLYEHATYYIFVRSKENTNYTAGPASTSLKVVLEPNTSIEIGSPTVKIFLDGSSSPLLEGGTTQISQGAGVFTINITPGTYSEIIWYLNGSEVSRGTTNTQIGIRKIAGTYLVTVEATMAGKKNTGSHSFVVQ